ncbi:MAG: M23 family peptidase [Bacteroidetes bacterium]|nr:MAG: M23 family peptidase [Bacteroidota bacterium]
MHTYRLYADGKTEDKKETNFKSKFYKSFVLKLLFVVTFSAIIFVVFSNIIQHKEKNQLENEKQNLLVQFELLNDRMGKAENELMRIQKQEEDSYRKILEVEPMPESIKKAGFGGVNAYENYEGLLNSDLLISTAKRIDILSKKLTVQSKSFDEIIELAKEREKKLAQIPSIFPLYYNDLQKIGSGFGPRKHPILKRVKMHKGVDLVARKGKKIMSTGKGVVIRAKYSMGYGKHIKIDHGYGYVSVYAHMSKMKVKKGQIVGHGDLIGLVGNTGRSTGSNLHYEVWINGKAVDPEKFYSYKGQ